MNEKLLSSLEGQTEREEVSIRILLDTAFFCLWNIEDVAYQSRKELQENLDIGGFSKDVKELMDFAHRDLWKARKKMKQLGIPFERDEWELEDYERAESILPENEFLDKERERLRKNEYEIFKNLAKSNGLDEKISLEQFIEFLKVKKEKDNIDKQTIYDLIESYIVWAVGHVVDDLQLDYEIEGHLWKKLRRKIKELIG